MTTLTRTATDRHQWEATVFHAALEPRVKLVALALAAYSSPELIVHPDITLLAHGCGVSEITVARSLSTLRRLGLLKHRAHDGRWLHPDDEHQLTIPNHP